MKCLQDFNFICHRTIFLDAGGVAVVVDDVFLARKLRLF